MQTELNTSPVAVAYTQFGRIPALRAAITAQYQTVKFNDTGRIFVGDELVAFFRGCTFGITGLERLDRTFFASLPELRAIGKIGVGLDMIDLHAMADHGVAIGYHEGINKRAVAEHALTLLLSILHRIQQANADLRSGTWKRVMWRELTGSTVGIIGCGNIGQQLVALLRPFSCNLLINDIRDRSDVCREHGVRAASLDELLGAADIVSLHVPLDATTAGLMNGQRLRSMKHGAILVNTARGGLVDEAVLEELLATGWLAGAGSDVFAVEPADRASLLALPTFVATPHVAAFSEQTLTAMGLKAVESLHCARDPRSLIAK